MYTVSIDVSGVNPIGLSSVIKTIPSLIIIQAHCLNMLPMMVGSEHSGEVDMLGLHSFNHRFRRDRIDDGGFLRLLVNNLERWKTLFKHFNSR